MDPFYHEGIPSASGIYKITCTITKKIYIGSAINLQNRWRQHRQALLRKDHSNQKLQNAFNKYGEESFIFEILELVLPISLTAREQYWFDKLRPFGKRGYNIAITAGSNLGIKASPETIEKLRLSHLGQPGHWTGKKRPEIGMKISTARLGKPSPRYPGFTPSSAHREKLRQANLGKKASDEAKRNMAQAQIGRKKSPASIEKTRLANLGRKNSTEAIARMQDAHAEERKHLIITAPDGTEHVVHGIRAFCREHNLDRRSLQRVAQGKFKQHKGYKARYLEMDVS